MTVTATIATTQPERARERSFELAIDRADNGVEHGFAGPDKARLFYLAPYNPQLGRRDVRVVVVLANSIREI